MKTWLSLAAVLTLAGTATAQFPVNPLVGGPPPTLTPTGPLPPIPPARPMFRGPPGVYLYDSGNYLLGGFDGLSRSAGSFTLGGVASDPWAAYPGESGGAGACGANGGCGPYWGHGRKHHR